MLIHEYLERIRYQGSLEPTAQTLGTLHESHLLAVPFENLSIHAGQPILLQEEALYEKIVRRGRGGFCYELNGLFAWLLRQLGFRVSLLSAEVHKEGAGFNPAFDHLALLVHQLGESDWLVDVGFGDAFRRPLRLESEGEQVDSDGRVYDLLQASEKRAGTAERALRVMRRLGENGWEMQYRFTLQPYALSDFAARCQYHQTSQESSFTHGRICTLATPTGRLTLSEWRLITTTQGEQTERLLSSQEEYTAALANYFGVVV